MEDAAVPVGPRIIGVTFSDTGRRLRNLPDSLETVQQRIADAPYRTAPNHVGESAALTCALPVALSC